MKHNHFREHNHCNCNKRLAALSGNAIKLPWTQQWKRMGVTDTDVLTEICNIVRCRILHYKSQFVLFYCDRPVCCNKTCIVACVRFAFFGIVKDCKTRGMMRSLVFIKYFTDKHFKSCRALLFQSFLLLEKPWLPKSRPLTHILDVSKTEHITIICRISCFIKDK